jgi:hypothetical protein
MNRATLADYAQGSTVSQREFSAVLLDEQESK